MPTSRAQANLYRLSGYHDAKVTVRDKGVHLELVSDGGNTYTHGLVSWEQWEALVAWVNWRRNEQQIPN